MVDNKSISTTPPIWQAYVLGTVAVIIFGATLPVTRLALPDFSPWLLTFLRADIATILAALSLWWFGRPFVTGNTIPVFVAGLLLIHGFPGFMAIAMQTVPASHGGVVLGFLPLATAFIARLVAGEKPSSKFWFFTLAGFSIVVAYILLQEDETGQTGISMGDIWLLLAGLSASTGYVIFGKVSRKTPGWEVISRALILNLPVTLLGTLVFFDLPSGIPSTTGMISLAYLGIFSMFLGFCAWNVALAQGGISRIGQLQLLQIFATLFVSALLLNERIDLLTATAAIAVTVLIAASRKG